MKLLLRPFPQEGPYVAIDFETSATSGARACAVGLARMENRRLVATWYSLIRPPSRAVMFTRVHGLTWQDLKDAPTFVEIWPRIAAFIRGARYLIAHNAGFDSSVLGDCCAAYGLPRPRKPFLCTLRGARRGLALASYSLSAVCAHLDVPLNHHHAGSDAVACGLVHSHLRRLGVSDEQMLLRPTQTNSRRKSA